MCPNWTNKNNIPLPNAVKWLSPKVGYERVSDVCNLTLVSDDKETVSYWHLIAIIICSFTWIRKKVTWFNDSFSIMKLTKYFMSSESFLGVPYKHSFHKVLCTIGYTRPWFRCKIKIAFQNLLKYPLFRFWIK